MAWEARSGLKLPGHPPCIYGDSGLNGLGSPFGIETGYAAPEQYGTIKAKWPGKPVRD